MRRIRRIAEEEHILVVLLAGLAFVFLVIFPPFLLVNDTWMNLVAGREIWENGLPSRDELTVFGEGRTWTAQQWLAHLLFFGTHSVGGFALLALTACVVVVSAFAVAAAGARSLGAGPRAIWALFVPIVLAAPWAWTLRSQMLALPLYTGLVWLLASQARTLSSRVWLALPLLLAWAQIHGSVALGALLVMLLGGYELLLSRGRTWRRSSLLLILPPLVVLTTPNGPLATARYYERLLVNPPFAGVVTEWQWANPATNTLFFYALAAIAIPLVVWGRRRLTPYDVALLSLTLVGAVTAIRGIVWFALACMVILPVAIGRSLERREAQVPRRDLNIKLSMGLAVLVAATVSYSLLRDGSWYEQDWPLGPLTAVRQAADSDDLVFAGSRYADWLLWKAPELRGRVAFDVRFEVYDDDFFDRLHRYGWQEGDDWKSISDGYRIVLVDEARRSRSGDFLAEQGARAIYRDGELAVIERPMP